MYEHQMESKKGDSRMDVASLTGSDSNYFDTQEHVFIIRRASSSPPLQAPQPPSLPILPHIDNTLLPPATACLHSVQEQEEEQEQDEITTSATEIGAQTQCTLACCICTHGLPASFQTPLTWYVITRLKEERSTISFSQPLSISTLTNINLLLLMCMLFIA